MIDSLLRTTARARSPPATTLRAPVSMPHVVERRGRLRRRDAASAFERRQSRRARARRSPCCATSRTRLPLVWPRASAHAGQHRALRPCADAARRARSRCCRPQGYLEMLGLMAARTLVLTDSGGIQEETTALAVPCLTMRENTERPITVEQGTNTLVGRDRARVRECVDDILADRRQARPRARAVGRHAAERIAADLAAWLADRRRRRSVGSHERGRTRHACALRSCRGADRQCADDRRRGLLPGVRVRAAHRAQRVGRARVPRRAQRRADPRAAGRRRRQGDVLHARLDRRALSGSWCGGIARCGPRAREPRLRAPARDRADAAANSWPTSGLRRRSSKTSRGATVARLPRAELFDRRGEPVGVRRIAEAGYRYSSSIYPIRHDHYGVPDAPRFAHEVAARTARDARRDGAHAAVATGPPAAAVFPPAALRAVALVDRARSTRIDRQPAMFYFHPWELDPEQPRVAGVGAKTRFRHYLNLRPDGAAADAAARAISAGTASTASSCIRRA